MIVAFRLEMLLDGGECHERDDEGPWHRGSGGGGGGAGRGAAGGAWGPGRGRGVGAGVGEGGMIALVLWSGGVMLGEEERTRAGGIWAAANFLALPVGPIVGGWLLSNYWWGWVFLMNLPIVVIGLAAMALLVPESRAAEQPGLDPGGVGASCVGLALLGYCFIAARQYSRVSSC